MTGEEGSRLLEFYRDASRILGVFGEPLAA
jgi:hypothetical protein